MPYFCTQAVTSGGWRCGHLADRRVGELQHLAALALGDPVLGRLGLGAGDLVLAVGGDDDAGLAVAVRDHPVGLGAADLSRVLLDVVVDAQILVRPRERPAVDADQHDPLLRTFLHRILHAGDVGIGDDAVDLQRHCLVVALEPGLGAAAAVDQGDLPANLLAGLDHGIAPLA